MINEKSEFIQYAEKRLEDFLYLTLGTALSGTVDYLGELSINHPEEDIAFGAGVLCGARAVEAELSGEPLSLIPSLLVLGATMYPDIVQIAAYGDIPTFLKGVGLKIILYGFGTIVGGFVRKYAEKH